MAKKEIRVDPDRLAVLQKMRNLDDMALAAKMNRHYNTVRRIKIEKTTSLSGLEALCEALDCHPFDLLVAEGYPKAFLAAPVGP